MREATVERFYLKHDGLVHLKVRTVSYSGANRTGFAETTCNVIGDVMTTGWRRAPRQVTCLQCLEVETCHRYVAALDEGSVDA